MKNLLKKNQTNMKGSHSTIKFLDLVTKNN